MKMPNPLPKSAVLVGALISVSPPATAQDRTWLPQPREVAEYVDADGDLFGAPHRIFASPRGGLALDDWGDISIREFSGAGELEWCFGCEGSGPGEFLRMMDVEFDWAGNLLVLDMDLGRVTVTSPSGQLVETHSVPSASQLLPRNFHRGNWPVLSDSPDTLWVSRDDVASTIRCQAVCVGVFPSSGL